MQSLCGSSTLAQRGSACAIRVEHHIGLCLSRGAQTAAKRVQASKPLREITLILQWIFPLKRFWVWRLPVAACGRAFVAPCDAQPESICDTQYGRGFSTSRPLHSRGQQAKKEKKMRNHMYSSSEGKQHLLIFACMGFGQNQAQASTVA